MSPSVNKQKLSHQIVDVFIILLHVTYGMSMLNVWLLDPLHIPFRLDLILLTFVAFRGRFGAKFRLLSIKNNHLLWLFIIIYLADFLQNVITTSAVSAIIRLITLLDLYLFMEYIYAMYIEARTRGDNPIDSILSSYCYYSLYNIATVILCAALMLVGVLSPFDNPMSSNSLIENNLKNGALYFFPGHLSIAIEEMRGLAAFNIPVLTGLSHEPHVLFLLVGPAFFIFLKKWSSKPIIQVLLYVSMLLCLVIATSVTAIVVFVVVIVVEQLYSLSIGENKVRHVFVLLIFTVIVVWFISKGGGTIADTILSLIEEKSSSDNDDSSMGYSFNMLLYMVTPEHLIGSGNIPLAIGQAAVNEDIGFLSCFLDILFFLIMFAKTFKNILSKNSKYHYWGLASLYFLLHMQKLSYMMFSFPVMAFFVIITIIIDNERISAKTIKTKISYEQKKNNAKSIIGT